MNCLIILSIFCILLGVLGCIMALVEKMEQVKKERKYNRCKFLVEHHPKYEVINGKVVKRQ